eukprot:TRINITY_DN3434_c0_g1_i1.p1 TRINITY_DN3434_c0_g1~~TRINITY_DN3434_c0_g1_i1.p1  ORF type:complete len:351 (-),score=91.99 TRINITY_DN3434_c0_g1_i1:10-1062(-)
MSIIVRPALILIAWFALRSYGASVPPVPVILDTDIGTDFDDMMALTYMLSRPDLFDVRLVIVSTFNTTKRAQVAAKVLSTLGRYDVPLAVGEYTGEQPVPQYPWAADFDLKQFVAKGGQLSYGVGSLAKAMASGTPTSPIHVVEIAPATSVGSVLASAPTLAAGCRCFAMSGSVNVGYMNSSKIDAEYNVHEDITASQFMYNASWAVPLATAPLDTTIFEQWNGDVYAAFLAANDTAHPFVQVLLQAYQVWYDNGGKNAGALLPFSPSTGTSTMYDPQAAWSSVHFADLSPLVVRTIPLGVNASGFTVPLPNAKMVAAELSFQGSPTTSAGQIGNDILQSLVHPQDFRRF